MNGPDNTPAAVFRISSASARGFSLIEIAIVLVIVGLLLGGLLGPLQSQQEMQDTTETQEVLDETLLTLYGYAYANGFLPCPDTDGDGLEDFAGGNCSNVNGDIPWATLGSPDGDGFRGNRLGYRIDANLNNHAPISCSVGASIQICTDNTCATTLSTRAALVIWSFGKNGYLATNAQGGINTVPGAVTLSNDELENSNGDAIFVRRQRTAGNTVAGEFDDMVEFVSESLLCAKLVEAGAL
ncbi:MAG TPA: prepilin-type cleavage/methylation domain-containing protein [Gammaproteobacteria bacterium]|nr:prepilin-type cleavage/methylation domain-containing protein [Gammaproteobacteria bacterium]